MPNWCSNYLEVTGSEEKLREFDNKFKAKHISMETSQTSMPEAMFKAENYVGKKYKVVNINKKGSITLQVIDSIKEVEGYSFVNFVPPTEEDYLNGWYDWNCNNWGTKWGICDLQEPDNLDDKPLTSIGYSFCTAWSPCTPVIESMAKAFPELSFEYSYEECGMQFAGIKKYNDGELTESLESEEDKYREFLKEHMEREYYTCKDCGALLEEYELEDNENKCSECESANIVDFEGNPVENNNENKKESDVV